MVESVATTVVLVQKQMPINPGIMMTTEISQVQYVDKEALVIKHVMPARVATFNPADRRMMARPQPLLPAAHWRKGRGASRAGHWRKGRGASRAGQWCVQQRTAGRGTCDEVVEQLTLDIEAQREQLWSVSGDFQHGLVKSLGTLRKL